MKRIINNYLCNKCDRIVSGRRVCKTCMRIATKKVFMEKKEKLREYKLKKFLYLFLIPSIKYGTKYINISV